MAGKRNIREIFDSINRYLALPIVVSLIALSGFLYNEHKEQKKLENELIARQLSEFYVPLRDSLRASTIEWQNFRRHFGKDKLRYFDSAYVVTDENGKIHHVRSCNDHSNDRYERFAAIDENIKPKDKYEEFDKKTWKTEKTYDLGRGQSLTVRKCPLKKEDVEMWITQMQSTFRPFHQRWEDLISNKRYLIGNDQELAEQIDVLMLHITGYKKNFLKWEKGDYSILVSQVNFPKRLEGLLTDRIDKLGKKIDPRFSPVPRQSAENGQVK